jgi:stress-induced morphogen
MEGKPHADDCRPVGTNDQNGIARCKVDITDLRGDGDHYAAHVVSKAFAGKTRVQQHQMVYDALGGGMGDTLHALALQTSVPDDA